MSKGNLFLGYARGKVGDVVFYHTVGEQITRARNRSPKNPKSPLQTLQRICFNTASKAYSYMQGICDHSFEGFAEGTPCQSEFMRLNISMLRDKLAYPIAYPDEDVMLDSGAYNYNMAGDVLPVANEWQISSGSITPVRVSRPSASSSMMYILTVPYISLSESTTYQDIVNGLKLQRGDQLTFVAATISTMPTLLVGRSLLSGFTYARIILEPSTGEMSLPFLTGSNDTWVVNSPNPSNEGTITFGAISQSASHSLPVNSINTITKQGDDTQSALYPILGAVIVSRQVGGRWLRSSQSLVWTRAEAYIPQEDMFRLAYLSYRESAGSSLYLNQAD